MSHPDVPVRQRATMPGPARGAAGIDACRRAGWATLGALALLWGAACSDPQDRTDAGGIVFFDLDGDGIFSAGDEPMTAGHVFCETRLCATIDGDGRYDARIAAGTSSILWVRSGGRADPGPFWILAQGLPGESLDIPVRPVSGSGPFSFVAASDTHAGIGVMDPKDQVFGLVQATQIEPRPYFIAVTGDITQSNRPEQFEHVLAGIDAIDVPYVPVPGNHDWYDGGAAYRGVFGPPNYSFDSGGLHFIVLNDADSVAKKLDFVAADLSLVDGDPPVVVLMHAPPGDELLHGLERRKVDYLLTGHLHSNRVMVHEQAIQYNTQPLVMGGIDLTPGGSRVFTVGEDGRLLSQGRTTVNRPIFRLVAPTIDQIAPACQVRIVVAVEAGRTVSAVTARVDGGGPHELRHAGGWVYESAPIETCEAGPHTVEVAVTLVDGTSEMVEELIEVGAPAPVTGVTDWPMLQGDPQHTGASATPIQPPLATRWVATVGGHVQGGAPVVAGGRVFVSVSDFGEGTPGGVVALDAATGQALWATRVGFSVRNAPAVGDGLVVFL
ncbi:MAG TPA: metallophosphoesterase, partial [Haliangium sp.]|nr:metallophosphoesterase [Haliangium sp.]